MRYIKVGGKVKSAEERKERQFREVYVVCPIPSTLLAKMLKYTDTHSQKRHSTLGSIGLNMYHYNACYIYFEQILIKLEFSRTKTEEMLVNTNFQQ